MHDHYETLQVHPRADAEAVRAAYERLRQRYDPAALEGAADELVELARRRRDEIERAFTVLGDAQRRTAYDAELAERATPTPATTSAEPSGPPDDELIDYRPLPPARRQERPKGFNPQPTLPRSVARSSGRRVDAPGRVPIWVPPVLIVAAATFAIVLVTLITTVSNAPVAPSAPTGGPSILGAAPTAAATPSADQVINQFEGQVVAARQVATQVPENPNAWIELGNALYDSVVVVRERLGSGEQTLQNAYVERLPRWLEAADAYRKALDLQPDNPIVRADLAASLCYYGADANDQASVVQGMGEAEQALSSSPEEGRVLLSMGLCLVSSDPPQTQQALAQWQKLVVLPNIDPALVMQARQLISAYSQQ